MNDIKEKKQINYNILVLVDDRFKSESKKKKIPIFTF